MSTSMLPNRPASSSTKMSTERSAPASQKRENARSSFATRVSAIPSQSVRMSSAPCSAKACAQASPAPLAAPEISTRGRSSSGLNFIAPARDERKDSKRNTWIERPAGGGPLIFDGHVEMHLVNATECCVSVVRKVNQVSGLGKSQKRPGGRTADVTARVHKAITELILEGGFEACTFSAVAERAGIERSTLYRRFPDRFDAIIDTWMTRAQIDVMPDPGGSFAADLMSV